MWSSKVFCLLLVFQLYNPLLAQELFPLNEPASTVPKGIVGVRLTSNLHYKYSTLGHKEMLRLIYGVTSNVSVMLTASHSNFHVEEFPEDLNVYFNDYHNHKATKNFYPNSFEGVHLFTKYRFFSRDEKNEHLRVAAFNELSFNWSTHVDAFPSLIGDNSGASLGIIVTKLKKKFAISLLGSGSTFFAYATSDQNGEVNFKPGNCLNLNLSMGYLLFPRTYKSYRDVNFNLYMETQSKFYRSTVIVRDGFYVNSDQFPYLRGGNFININPGMQFIFNSRTRLDLSIELPIYNSNDVDLFAMLMLSVQRYFY